MFREVARVSWKILRFVTCLAVAGYVVWRGNTFSDAHGNGHLIVPVMCVTAGVTLGLTGLAMGLKTNE